VHEAAVTRSMAGSLKRAQLSYSATFNQRPQLADEGDERVVLGAGPDGCAVGPGHDFGQSTDVVSVGMGQHDVGDVAPPRADALQRRSNEVVTARQAGVDQDHAAGMGNQEAAHVEAERIRTGHSRRQMNIHDDWFNGRKSWGHGSPLSCGLAPWWEQIHCDDLRVPMKDGWCVLCETAASAPTHLRPTPPALTSASARTPTSGAGARRKRLVSWLSPYVSPYRLCPMRPR